MTTIHTRQLQQYTRPNQQQLHTRQLKTSDNTPSCVCHSENKRIFSDYKSYALKWCWLFTKIKTRCTVNKTQSSNSSSLCSNHTASKNTHETSKLAHVPSKQLYKHLFGVPQFRAVLYKSVFTAECCDCPAPLKFLSTLKQMPSQ